MVNIRENVDRFEHVFHDWRLPSVLVLRQDAT